MVRKTEFHAFKVLLLAVALMPLAALAVAPPPTLYLDDEDGILRENDEDGDEVLIPGVAIGGIPGARTLELTDFNYATIADPAFILPSNTTIVIEGINSIKSNGGDGILSPNNITVKEGHRQGELEVIASGSGIKANKLTVASGTVIVEGGAYGIDLGVVNEYSNFSISSGFFIVNGGNRAFKNDYMVPAAYNYRTEDGGQFVQSGGEDAIGAATYFEIHGFDPVPSINLYVTTPVTGVVPVAPMHDANAKFEIYSWMYRGLDAYDGAKFEEGKEYTIEIQLVPKLGYVFSGSTVVYVNNKVANIKENFDNVLNLEYKFGITSSIVITIEDENMAIVDDTVWFKVPFCGKNSVNIEVITDQNTKIMLGGQIEQQSIKYSMPLYDYGDNMTSMIITVEETSKYYVFAVNKPVRFADIVKQKWNNVLVVKNNDKELGGLYFTEFKWFKNNEELLGETRQFYSADPSGSESLNPNDEYYVYMKTEDGMEVRTCPYRPPSVAKIAVPTTQKRVLGIDGKTAPQDYEVYNTKGERATGKTPGVYIIRRPSK